MNDWIKGGTNKGTNDWKDISFYLGGQTIEAFISASCHRFVLESQVSSWGFTVLKLSVLSL